jgi:serine/threonine protein kinase
MPVPETANQFIDLACKSGLLSAQHVQGYLQGRRAVGPLPNEPAALADVLIGDGLLTRWQAEQLLAGRWRNFVLTGKYTILGPLGAGGMGCVYLCEHRVMRRPVAVKVLPTRRAEDPTALERFRREARAVAQLKHPNIVGGHDIDSDGRVHFLVMEYVDGSTFHTIVQSRGPFDPIRAAHYIRQAALGLQHAHEAGLVHRDIKPSNLLLDRTGTVKVLDLGLARFFRDEADDLSRQRLESPLGTTDYMAPEQALDSHQADIRADIYSLGATFYFLLAGHGPYKEGTPIEKLVRRQVEGPRPVREIRPEVPEGLAAVLERMMARDPAERYPTPAAVAEALETWTAVPIPPPPAEEMPGLLRPARGAGDPDGLSKRPASLYGRVSAPGTAPARPAAATPLPVEQGVDTPHSPQGIDTPRSPRRDGGERSRPNPAARAGSVREAAGSRSPSPATGPDRSSTVAAAALPSAAGEDSSWGRDQRWRRPAVLTAAVVLALGVVVAGLAFFRRGAGDNPSAAPAGPPAGTVPVASASPPARLKLLVPAYFYPAGEGLGQWDRIIDSPAAAATVAIVNPNSGAGKAADPNYVRVVDRARLKRVTVIGYVSTKYAARPLAEVQAEVDRWVSFYPGIQGIFFDEQASGADRVAYYGALYDHVRRQRGLSLVVSNPGTVCAEDYLARPAADVVCLVEVAKDLGAYKRPPWAEHYSSDHFAALLCSTGSAEQMRTAVAQMRDQRIGYCYITDAQEPNPWARLPQYWETEVEAVRAAAVP